jgi:site-specific DNA-methyltransferase (adenine-specific)
MKKKGSIERLYDVLDESAMLYYEQDKCPYLQGVVRACENIMAGSADEDDQSLTQQLNRLIDGIKGIEFKKESVRRAMQLCILKGFKHTGRSNEGLTPDSIGMFMAYLLDKLVPGNERTIVFDPLVGTGNLLTTVANHSKKTRLALCGVEQDRTMYPIARAMFDMMGYGDQVYFQDTLSFSNIHADVMVTDFPLDPDGDTFIYELLNHHVDNVRDGGYVLGLVDNDFFGKAGSDTFQTTIFERWHFIGLVHLPESMFTTGSKSILLLKKSGEGSKKPTRALMADIPSFDDKAGLEASIHKINQWFKEYNEKEGE